MKLLTLENMKAAIAAVLASAIFLPASAQDYTDGVFVLNEDWYGHNNSSLNFWNDSQGYADYLVFQMANPGYSLGCTAQYGQIFGDYFYVMSKQDRDPGEKDDLVSGRFTVFHKKTMKLADCHQIINVSDDGRSTADGRACLGVTTDKIYIGSSNGIYIYTPSTKSISEAPIEGTENPLITGEETPGDGQGPLYQNQIGMMLRGQDYIFAVKQDEGILVIDPTSDKVVKTIKGCFSTMAQSLDGSVWAGMNVAQGENSFGVPYQHYPYGDNGDKWDGSCLVRIDQYSLETEYINLSQGMGGIPQSWYAWTAGPLAASPKENALYYVYSDPSQGRPSWFTQGALYKFDIASRTARKIYDSSEDNLHFYASALRISPVDGNLYAHLYAGDNIACKNWVYITLDKDGNIQKTYRPIERYWYPAMMIFPDNALPVADGMPSEVEVGANALTITLADKISDPDTPAWAIVKRIAGNTAPQIVEAKISQGNLLLKALGNGEAQVTVQFDSNGLLTESTINVTANTSLIEETGTPAEASLFLTGNTLHIEETPQGTPAEVCDIAGRSIWRGTAPCTIDLPQGFFIVTLNNNSYKFHVRQ